MSSRWPVTSSAPQAPLQWLIQLSIFLKLDDGTEHTFSKSADDTKLGGVADKWEVIQRDPYRLEKEADVFSEHKSAAAGMK